MPTPYPSRQTARPSWTGGATSRPTTAAKSDWRCARCGKLLGVFQDERLHLRMVRGHEYFVSLPVTCTCRGCGGLNETPRPFGPRAA